MGSSCGWILAIIKDKKTTRYEYAARFKALLYDPCDKKRGASRQTIYEPAKTDTNTAATLMPRLIRKTLSGNSCIVNRTADVINARGNISIVKTNTTEAGFMSISFQTFAGFSNNKKALIQIILITFNFLNSYD